MELKEIGIEFAHHGEERELNATEKELELFALIIKVIEDYGQKTDDIVLTRNSGNYLSVKIPPSDIARIKYTDRAKWIQLPYGVKESGKRYIDEPEDILSFKDDIVAHYYLAMANKLLGY